MSTHRLRVVDFDAPLSKNKGESISIENQRKKKNKHKYGAVIDNKQIEKDERAGGDTNTTSNSTFFEVSSKISSSIRLKHRSSSEIFRIPLRNNLKKHRRQSTLSFENIKKAYKNNGNKIHCRIQDNNKAELSCVISNGGLNEKPRKNAKSDKHQRRNNYRISKDVFGFQKTRSDDSCRIYQMSCDYLNVDKQSAFKRIKKGLSIRRRNKNPLPRDSRTINKCPQLKVLNSESIHCIDNKESPLLYNVTNPTRTNQIGLETCRRDNYKDKSHIETKDVKVSVSPSSLVSITKCNCDAACGYSKSDIPLRTETQPCPYHDALKSRISRPFEPIHTVITNSLGFQRKHAAHKSRKRKKLVSELVESITNYRMKQSKQRFSKRCLANTCFRFLVILWLPCMLPVILVWTVLCPSRMSQLQGKSLPEEKEESVTYSNSYQCYQMHASEPRPKHKGILSSVGNWYARVANTAVTSLQTALSVFKQNKVKALTYTGSSIFRGFNRKNKYHLYYQSNRGWVMKPLNRRRKLITMRCEVCEKPTEINCTDIKEKSGTKVTFKSCQHLRETAKSHLSPPKHPPICNQSQCPARQQVNITAKNFHSSNVITNPTHTSLTSINGRTSAGINGHLNNMKQLQLPIITNYVIPLYGVVTNGSIHPIQHRRQTLNTEPIKSTQKDLRTRPCILSTHKNSGLNKVSKSVRADSLDIQENTLKQTGFYSVESNRYFFYTSSETEPKTHKIKDRIKSLPQTSEISFSFPVKSCPLDKKEHTKATECKKLLQYTGDNLLHKKKAVSPSVIKMLIRPCGKKICVKTADEACGCDQIKQAPSDAKVVTCKAHDCVLKNNTNSPCEYFKGRSKSCQTKVSLNSKKSLQKSYPLFNKNPEYSQTIAPMQREKSIRKIINHVLCKPIHCQTKISSQVLLSNLDNKSDIKTKRYGTEQILRKRIGQKKCSPQKSSLFTQRSTFCQTAPLQFKTRLDRFCTDASKVSEGFPTKDNRKNLMTITDLTLETSTKICPYNKKNSNFCQTKDFPKCMFPKTQDTSCTYEYKYCPYFEKTSRCIQTENPLKSLCKLSTCVGKNSNCTQTKFTSRLTKLEKTSVCNTDKPSVSQLVTKSNELKLLKELMEHLKEKCNCGAKEFNGRDNCTCQFKLQSCQCENKKIFKLLSSLGPPKCICEKTENKEQNVSKIKPDTSKRSSGKATECECYTKNVITSTSLEKVKDETENKEEKIFKVKPETSKKSSDKATECKCYKKNVTTSTLLEKDKDETENKEQKISKIKAETPKKSSDKATECECYPKNVKRPSPLEKLKDKMKNKKQDNSKINPVTPKKSAKTATECECYTKKVIISTTLEKLKDKRENKEQKISKIKTEAQKKSSDKATECECYTKNVTGSNSLKQVIGKTAKNSQLSEITKTPQVKKKSSEDAQQGKKAVNCECYAENLDLAPSKKLTKSTRMSPSSDNIAQCECSTKKSKKLNKGFSEKSKLASKNKLKSVPMKKAAKCLCNSTSRKIRCECLSHRLECYCDKKGSHVYLPSQKTSCSCSRKETSDKIVPNSIRCSTEQLRSPYGEIKKSKRRTCFPEDAKYASSLKTCGFEGSIQSFSVFPLEKSHFRMYKTSTPQSFGLSPTLVYQTRPKSLPLGLVQNYSGRSRNSITSFTENTSKANFHRNHLLEQPHNYYSQSKAIHIFPKLNNKNLPHLFGKETINNSCNKTIYIPCPTAQKCMSERKKLNTCTSKQNTSSPKIADVPTGNNKQNHASSIIKKSHKYLSKLKNINISGSLNKSNDNTTNIRKIRESPLLQAAGKYLHKTKSVTKKKAKEINECVRNIRTKMCQRIKSKVKKINTSLSLLRAYKYTGKTQETNTSSSFGTTQNQKMNTSISLEKVHKRNTQNKEMNTSLTLIKPNKTSNTSPSLEKAFNLASKSKQIDTTPSLKKLAEDISKTKEINTTSTLEQTSENPNKTIEMNTSSTLDQTLEVSNKTTAINTSLELEETLKNSNDATITTNSEQVPEDPNKATEINTSSLLESTPATSSKTSLSPTTGKGPVKNAEINTPSITKQTEKEVDKIVKKNTSASLEEFDNKSLSKLAFKSPSIENICKCFSGAKKKTKGTMLSSSSEDLEKSQYIKKGKTQTKAIQCACGARTAINNKCPACKNKKTSVSWKKTRISKPQNMDTSVCCKHNHKSPHLETKSRPRLHKKKIDKACPCVPMNRNSNSSLYKRFVRGLNQAPLQFAPPPRCKTTPQYRYPNNAFTPCRNNQQLPMQSKECKTCRGQRPRQLIRQNLPDQCFKNANTCKPGILLKSSISSTLTEKSKDLSSIPYSCGCSVDGIEIFSDNVTEKYLPNHKMRHSCHIKNQRYTTIQRPKHCHYPVKPRDTHIPSSSSQLTSDTMFKRFFKEKIKQQLKKREKSCRKERSPKHSNYTEQAKQSDYVGDLHRCKVNNAFDRTTNLPNIFKKLASQRSETSQRMMHSYNRSLKPLTFTSLSTCTGNLLDTNSQKFVTRNHKSRDFYNTQVCNNKIRKHTKPGKPCGPIKQLPYLKPESQLSRQDCYNFNDNEQYITCQSLKHKQLKSSFSSIFSNLQHMPVISEVNNPPRTKQSYPHEKPHRRRRDNSVIKNISQRFRIIAKDNKASKRVRNNVSVFPNNVEDFMMSGIYGSKLPYKSSNFIKSANLNRIPKLYKPRIYGRSEVSSNHKILCRKHLSNYLSVRDKRDKGHPSSISCLSTIKQCYMTTDICHRQSSMKYKCSMNPKREKAGGNCTKNTGTDTPFRVIVCRPPNFDAMQRSPLLSCAEKARIEAKLRKAKIASIHQQPAQPSRMTSQTKPIISKEPSKLSRVLSKMLLQQPRVTSIKSSNSLSKVVPSASLSNDAPMRFKRPQKPQPIKNKTKIEKSKKIPAHKIKLKLDEEAIKRMVNQKLNNLKLRKEIKEKHLAQKEVEKYLAQKQIEKYLAEKDIAEKDIAEKDSGQKEIKENLSQKETGKLSAKKELDKYLAQKELEKYLTQKEIEGKDLSQDEIEKLLAQKEIEKYLSQEQIAEKDLAQEELEKMLAQKKIEKYLSQKERRDKNLAQKEMEESNLNEKEIDKQITQKEIKRNLFQKDIRQKELTQKGIEKHLAQKRIGPKVLTQIETVKHSAQKEKRNNFTQKAMRRKYFAQRQLRPNRLAQKERLMTPEEEEKEETGTRWEKFVKRVKKTDAEAWPERISCRPLYLNTMKSRPCFWVYKMCPTCYPMFLRLLSILGSIGRMLLIFVSICIWSPFFICCYFCGQMYCGS